MLNSFNVLIFLISSIDAIPPETTTGDDEIFAILIVYSRLGPVLVPSRSM